MANANSIQAIMLNARHLAEQKERKQIVSLAAETSICPDRVLPASRAQAKERNPFF
jgi:hypothetical protein